jgi:NAD(P)-dependent dehydrogenase (short-subunit alcohol dehydrogenase family)
MGQACALAFAKAGCSQFALLDLNEAGLRTTEEQIKAINAKAEVLLLPVNITEESEVVRVVQAAGQRFGRLDYVVQCAGLNQRPRALLHETEMVNYDKVMDINLRGLYMVQREVVRIMLKQTTPVHGQKGSIVNISSNAAVQPMPRLVPVGSNHSFCHR